MKYHYLLLLATLYTAPISAAPYPQTFTHADICDASTAVAIAPGLMIVGEDESQDLVLYKRNASGKPLSKTDVSKVLELTDRTKKEESREVDIEASTAVGNRIYWLASHSNAGEDPSPNKSGAIRVNRYRVFTMDVTAGTVPGLKFVGMYKDLRKDLLAWDAKGMHGKNKDYYRLADSARAGIFPEHPGADGFNIEGLSMKPGNATDAYLGFRAPLQPTGARRLALIVPVKNFAALAAGKGGPAGFGPPIELDLGGRGIRSLECNDKGCLIVAGPATGTGDFRLFSWDGLPNGKLQERHADIPVGIKPEGIVELPEDPMNGPFQVQLIIDDGDGCVTPKQFRSVIVNVK